MFVLLLIFWVLQLVSSPVSAFSSISSKYAMIVTKTISCYDHLKVGTSSTTSLQMMNQDTMFVYSGSVRPGKQSPQRTVMDRSIMLPDYALNGRPKQQVHMPWMPTVEVKTPKEIELMRAAGRCAREVLDIAGKAVHAGVTTDEIDALVHEETLKVRAILGYILERVSPYAWSSHKF